MTTATQPPRPGHLPRLRRHPGGSMTWITIALIIGLATATVALTAGAACLVASYVAHRVALVTTAQVIRAAFAKARNLAGIDQPNDPPTPSRSVN